MKTSLILACAGKGTRAGFDKNKLLIAKDGVTILEQTLNAFANSKLIDQIIIATSEVDFDFVKDLVKDNAQVVLGGATRSASIKNALALVEGDIVLIHDGARPFVTNKLISDCIETAKEFGSAIPIAQNRNAILKKEGDSVVEYLGKEDLSLVQTPQGFVTSQIKKAYELAGDKAFGDDGELYLTYMGNARVYAGDQNNIKLTFKEDFSFADDNKEDLYRFGVGFDCHKLVEKRKLILGGVTIPHEKGLLGHSDADVLTHAVMDAILSALSLRDIGYHFSDKDPQYKDANSIMLLRRVLEMIKEKGYRVQSISATIMAEKPKLLKHIPAITENLAKELGVKESFVGIGATTLEGLGFVGREEGICTHATATLIKI
jgi:2-C-methyl-D-erythritol 2,4-cyclodiphosphate synthase/2-C-methyl-D-erythritol 4-phosphate cytidylyltransferase